MVHTSGRTKIARVPRKDPWGPSVRSFLFPSPLRFSLRCSFYYQKNVMYCSSRSFPNVVFGFVFPAKFSAYKLLPPLCLISTHPPRPPLFPPPVAPTLEHRAIAHSLSFSFSRLNPLLFPPANDSRSYGFLSLINYRVARGLLRSGKTSCSFLSGSSTRPRVLRFSQRRVVSRRDGRKRRC